MEQHDDLTSRCLALSRRGFWDEVRDLIEQHPACAHHRNESGETLLHALAGMDGAAEVIQVLTALGADVNAETTSGATPAGNAIHSGHRLGVDTDDHLRLLIDAGADLSKFDETGNPPLHAAIYENRPNAVKLLLASGADPAQCNAYGEDARAFAVRHGLDAMQTLLPDGRPDPHEHIGLLSDERMRTVLRRFIDTFVQTPLKERWLSLTEGARPRWEDIDPYRIHVDEPAARGFAKELACRKIADVFKTYQIEDARRVLVVVASVGRGAKGLMQMTMEEALVGAGAPLEGFVLYQPERLNFCLGHRGDVWEVSR